MINRHIFIFLIKCMFTGNLFSQANHFISGTVVDANDEPLIGANIILKGTFFGSTTDTSGFYKVESIEPGKYTMLISYIGYKSQELELYLSEF